MINSGVVAAIHVAGIRGDPCGAVRSNALHHKGHHVHCSNGILTSDI